MEQTVETIYRIKLISELADHFEEKAKALRAETRRRKSDRLRNEALAEAYENAAETVRRTVLEKS
jgi:hypothetical protein